MEDSYGFHMRMDILQPMKSAQPVAVQRLSLHLPGLPSPVRIAQLTDLHFGWATPLEKLEAAVEEVNNERPDVAVLTGDVASWRPGSIRSVRRTLSAIGAPRVAVLGNHDHYVGANLVAGALRDAGFVVLRNELAAVGGLWFAGVDDPVTRHDDTERAIRDLPAGRPVIGLVHDPRGAHALWRCGVRLVLSGHTHGGHFDIGRWPERLLRTPFVAGLHETDKGSVYVCPGVGSATWRWRYGPRSRPAIGSLLVSG